MRTVRIKKPDQLKVQDFYQTHPFMVKCLCDNFDIQGTVLDPCAGGGIIADNLSTNVEEMDLFPKLDRIVEKDFLSSENNSYDYIVMNPPYSNKYAFILKALEVAQVVFVLLPLDVSNYNLFHREYLNTKQYRGRLLMTPKVMLHSGVEMKKGGNSSYAWYEFSQEPNGDRKYEIYGDLNQYAD